MTRIVALLKSTQEQLAMAHPFFDDAGAVLDKITPDNPAAGIMAINMVSLAIVELLSRRGCAARICLVAALGLVEDRMHATLLDLFEQAIAQNRPENAPSPMPPAMEQIVQALLKNQGVIGEVTSDGQCKIKVGNQVFNAVKIPLDKPTNSKKKAGKALPPTNPLN